MEALHCLKYLLEENNFLCKIVLKGPYFSVPLCTSSGKFVKFAWSGNLYEFHCLCFELGPAPRMFSKLLEVPIALLRRLNIRLVIYLDDILLMGRTLEEILMSRDTLIFLLQHLGFVMNLKSVLKPAQQIEFLDLKRDFHTMALALTEEKMKKVILECQNLHSHPQTTALELKKIDRSDVLNCPSSSASSSTAKLFTTTTNTITFFSMEIQSLNQACSYQAEIVLNSLPKQQLLRWVKNLRLNNGRSLQQKEPNLVIQADASKSDWGAFSNGMLTGGKWLEKEENFQINILELIAAKFAILTFT